MTNDDLAKIESYWDKRGPHDLYRLIAEVRRLRGNSVEDERYIARLREELEKAKADLGARNRILTEEP